MTKVDHRNFNIAKDTDVILIAIGGGSRNQYLAEIAKILFESGLNISLYYDSEEFNLDSRMQFGECTGRFCDINEYLDKDNLVQSLLEGLNSSSIIVYFGENDWISFQLQQLNCRKICIYAEPFQRKFREGPAHISGALADGMLGWVGRKLLLKYHNRARQFFSFPKQGNFPEVKSHGYFSVRKISAQRQHSIDMLLCPEWFYDPFGTRDDSHICVGFVSDDHAIKPSEPPEEISSNIGSMLHLPRRIGHDPSRITKIIGYAADLVQIYGTKKISLFDHWDNYAALNLQGGKTQSGSVLAVHSGEIENIATAIRLGLPQVILFNQKGDIDNVFRTQQIGLAAGYDIAQWPWREVGIVLQFVADQRFDKGHTSSAKTIVDHECGLSNAAQFILEISRQH